MFKTFFSERWPSNFIETIATLSTEMHVIIMEINFYKGSQTICTLQIVKSAYDTSY